ncbi:MAG: hypothetical protein U5N85_01900 [Arcicella sp.]|nr:hypothetical protein [Arcicella sp.]
MKITLENGMLKLYITQRAMLMSKKTANEGVEDFEELVDLHNKDYPFPELELDWQEEDDSLEIKFPKLAKRCDELFK